MLVEGISQRGKHRRGSIVYWQKIQRQAHVKLDQNSTVFATHIKHTMPICQSQFHQPFILHIIWSICLGQVRGHIHSKRIISKSLVNFIWYQKLNQKSNIINSLEIPIILTMFQWRNLKPKLWSYCLKWP